MNDRLGWLAALAVVGALAGCSDSADEIVRPDYDDLTDEYDAVREASRDANITDPYDLPFSGSATYEGVMVLSTDGRDDIPADMAGDMTLRADFGDDTLSGSVDDVITSGQDRLEGSLDISEGEIVRDVDLKTEYTYAFDLNGTLTENDGTELEVDAVGAGDFLGDDHEQALGDVVPGSLIRSGDDTSRLGGGFVTTR